MPLSADSRCHRCFREGLRSFIDRGGFEKEGASDLLEEAMDIVMGRLASHPPPVAGAPAYALISGRVDREDIFSEEKELFTAWLCEELPALRRMIGESENPSRAALRMCTWGNLLDVAQGKPMPTRQQLSKLMRRPLAVDETEEFLERLSNADTFLLLGDNAGETVLDRLFLETVDRSVDVFYSVRPRPVLNDATADDAIQAGLDQYATLVTTGLDAPTVHLDMVGGELRRLLDRADVILSKGQGNLEGLLGWRNPRLFYSFVVKCPVISELTGLEECEGVFSAGPDLL